MRVALFVVLLRENTLADRRDYELMFAAQIGKPTLHLIDGIDVRNPHYLGTHCIERKGCFSVDIPDYPTLNMTILPRH